jgi:hypothetical protein
VGIRNVVFTFKYAIFKNKIKIFVGIVGHIFFIGGTMLEVRRKIK